MTVDALLSDCLLMGDTDTDFILHNVLLHYCNGIAVMIVHNDDDD